MGELVTVQVCEGISRGFAADARTRIAAVVSGADALVESLRVRIGTLGTAGLPGIAPGSAGPPGVVAQVNAEVDGRRIRVQEAAAAADLGEVLDRLVDGLRTRMSAVTAGWTPRPWPRRTRTRGLPAAPGALTSAGASMSAGAFRPAGASMSAGAAPPARAEPSVGAEAPVGAVARLEVPCPPEPLRRIVRHKRPQLVWCSPDAAARTMDAMDYDIHLFTDPATETDAVVYRVGPTGYRLARTVAAGPPTRPAVPLTLSPCGAPELSEEQAVERLTAAELPHLFFAQPGSGRGRVLYRRFDGGLGLIAAAS
ncbi:Sigma 54 modulation/S30EA ribosomal protein C terminus [Streptomyces sp. TLI_053]|uniref:sigma 54 modulation/S30EA ribosomal C-terminal domain-containing protein n=1 Tax=Streptomyces sp. TLI_053 TaxID=1855352 RepID=UPI00087B6D31|nr:sigma 54 modulation/S30EA ribosomal C-terminal domain-containing protein [Streptomyces sp. TLI_053]SDT82155.1 Sigma 54 modulation/S30EA ribosomal protein C terminus [Streptomyces sp. TLI_053]